MQIKAYNKSVEPNTINGQVQVSRDANAYGGNTTGSQALGVGLDAVAKQIQGYMDSQISLSALDAKNKYEAGMNDLLNNPQTGLLNQQDLNALDVVEKYQEGEMLVREKVLASMPNYRKAKESFLQMADGVKTQKLGTTMQYQYKADMEHRKQTLNTFIDNETNALIENNNMDGLYDVFNKNYQTAMALYGNVYGKERIDAMVRESNTKIFSNVITGLIATGDAGIYSQAVMMLEKAAPFINIKDLNNLRAPLLKQQRSNEKIQLGKEAQRLHPNDPKKQMEFLRTKNKKTITVGGANTGNRVFDWAINEGKKLGLDTTTIKYYAAQLMRETGGDTIEAMYMAPNGGYAQITRGTANDFKLDELYPGWDTNEEQNVRAGLYILKKKIEENKGDLRAGVKGYNGRGELADQYLLQVEQNMQLLNGIDFEGGSSAESFENNLIQGFQNARDIPINGMNGCAEEALSALSWANPWAAQAYQKSKFNVKDMADDAKANGIQEINYDPTQLSVGDLIIYTTHEGEYGHTVVYDGHGGYYGNSSSANNWHGGKTHENDINIPKMTPTKILKTGAGTHSGGTYTQTIDKYSEEELQEILNISARYDEQERQATNRANTALVRQGINEMQALYDQGILDYDSYLAIANRLGAGNGDVFRQLKGSIATYTSRPSSRGSTGSGGGSGRGGSGAGAQGMVILKSGIGETYSTLGEALDYCQQNNISLSPSEVKALSESFADYQDGKGEWAPEYDISMEQIETESGISKDEFKDNWPVIKQLIRGKAVQFKQETGRTASMNDLVKFGVEAITKDRNGFSQAQIRAAGIKEAYDIGGGYTRMVDWNGGTHTIYTPYAEAILRGETTLAEVENGTYQGGDDGSGKEGASPWDVVKIQWSGFWN